MFNYFNKFIKAQSLGNDFIIFDMLTVEAIELDNVLMAPAWTGFVRDICRRDNSGGADGVLVIRHNQEQIEVAMFNPDGSYAEKCLNGLRCVAWYLHGINYFSDGINLLMGGDFVYAEVNENEIILRLQNAKFFGEQEVVLNGESIKGYVVDVGNPHFVILNNYSQDWIRSFSEEIATHELFPRQTNVEFVSGSSDVFDIAVYERGAGFTLACGSGAAATMLVLLQLKKIREKEVVTLRMPGGELRSWIENGVVTQCAGAEIIA
ncbi:MAG: diaminopimelate epimerase [Gammaproteobacteria bacterium]|nr:diaminopimelate epimerase [Gammaproteobacteria bacterium]